MGSRKSKLIQHRMDSQVVGWLDELAAAERRSRTAELEHLIAQEWQRQSQDGAEPSVRLERLQLRVEGWRETAKSLRRQEPMDDETREQLDGMADAYDRAAAEIEMEIATRGRPWPVDHVMR